MLKIKKTYLFGKVDKDLKKLDTTLNSHSTYALLVSNAKTMWDKKSAKLFSEIREALDSVCIGARRCAYCEDSAADEVEHIYPKKFYPEKTFLWSNYLFACGPCNGTSKRDQFAVFSAGTKISHIKRKRKDPIIPPPVGACVFLDPRVEEPAAFMELDPITGLFVPIAKKGTIDFARAAYTIKILGLNKRDYLSKARRSAYDFFLDAITAYIEKKNGGATQLTLNKKILQITTAQHQSVFFEIGRLAEANQLNSHFWRDAKELWDEYAPF